MSENNCNIFKAVWIAVILSAPVWFVVLDFMGVFK